MRRFKNILYFADESTDRGSALERALALASDNQARLTIFDSLPARDSGLDVEGRSNLDIERMLRKDREAGIDRLVSSLNESRIEIRKRVVSGIAFVEVIRAVLAGQYDLVIKQARPPDSFVKRALGSTDLHLLRKCPCPIWIDRPDAKYPYRTLLAAVDPADGQQEDSARLIMDLATSLAEREQASLAIVHAWRLPAESLLRSGRAEISEVELERLLDETRTRHRDRLARLLAEYGIAASDARVHLVKGDPAPSIRALSGELDADLVIMGTLGGRAIPGVFIGNTAEDLLQTTQASVLAIKPLGFVTPVTSAASDGVTAG